MDNETEQEAVGSLEGPVPIDLERVIEQGDGRTISRPGVVLAYMDSPMYREKGLVWGLNPIQVVDSTGFSVGYASLYTENGMLLADIFADYSSPDRLTLETGAYPLYAYPIGFVGSMAVHVLAVKLDTGKPEDVRITPL